MTDRISRAWRKQPLLVSVCLGGFVWAASATLLPAPRERIVIDARTVQSVVEQRADLLGRDLTPEERDEAIEERIGEEILLREAYRRGLHLSDRAIRARLLRRMRLVINTEVIPPTSAQLRAYFAANPDQFQAPESVTLAHVYFENADLAADAARSTLEALSSGADYRSLGDRFWMGAELPQMTPERLAGAFGLDFARQVFPMPAGSWHGPVESTRGTHFVRIEERHPPSVPEFDGIGEFVRIAWTSDRMAQVTDRKLARMLGRYRIDVEGRE